MAVIKKTRCPNCAKRGKDRHGDNLILYQDGGEHCFSCGYHKPNQNKVKPTQPLQASKKDLVTLPYDLNTDIPPKALSWLSRYHITWQDIIDNNILWSESKKLLVFPLDNAWQGRYFGDHPTHPKWFNQGELDDLLYIKGKITQDNTIILVEDIVSSIRVAKLTPSIALFKAKISIPKLNQLKEFNNTICWWLDKDKQKEAAKQAIRASSLGINIKLIVTELDPKCYTEKEIKNIFDKFHILW